MGGLNLYLALKNSAINIVDTKGLEASSPIIAEDELIGPTEAEMFVDKVYDTRTLSGGWIAIYEIASVSVTVGVDASSTESWSGGEYVIDNPFQSDPNQPGFNGARMRLDVSIINQGALDFACCTRNATVGWKQTKAVGSDSAPPPVSDHPGRDFYQPGPNLADTPGGEVGLPDNLDFVSTLHCRNGDQKKLATFKWSVRWKLISHQKYQGTLSWDPSIMSN